VDVLTFQEPEIFEDPVFEDSLEGSISYGGRGGRELKAEHLRALEEYKEIVDDPEDEKVLKNLIRKLKSSDSVSLDPEEVPLFEQAVSIWKYSPVKLYEEKVGRFAKVLR